MTPQTCRHWRFLERISSMTHVLESDPEECLQVYQLLTDTLTDIDGLGTAIFIILCVGIWARITRPNGGWSVIFVVRVGTPGRTSNLSQVGVLSVLVINDFSATAASDDTNSSQLCGQQMKFIHGNKIQSKHSESMNDLTD